MVDDDRIARRGSSRRTPPERIGLQEARRILNISLPALHKIVKSGQLPGKLINRKWWLKKADVLRAKAEGTALKRPPRPWKSRVAWRRSYGPIPAGYRVAHRDGNRKNSTPDNLYLAPLKGLPVKGRRKILARYPPWTPTQIAILRAGYATRTTGELSEELGVSIVRLRQKARRLGVSKSAEAQIRQLKQTLHKRFPIGSERVDKVGVWVKASTDGTQMDQWKLKHHIIWEMTHGPKPPGTRILFKDGNKQNFDLRNLECVATEEMAVRALSKFHQFPPEVREAARLVGALEREVEASYAK